MKRHEEPKTAATTETTLHRYYFNLGKPAEKTAWEKLKAKLEAEGYGPRQMHSWGGSEAPCVNDSSKVTIELNHLFENQWNTTTERVFDWYLQYEVRGGNIARGHWLEITPDMQYARSTTFKCGYCGHSYGPLHAEPIPEDGFCTACLDSAYLKESDLHMLRLQSLAEKRTFPQLTEAEANVLVPRYVERQTTGKDSRAAQRRAKKRDDVLEEFNEKTASATTERDGLLWLWDKGLDLDNIIFYSHTGKFCFGWRTPVSAKVKSRIRDVIAEFPYSYEIKAEPEGPEAVKKGGKLGEAEARKLFEKVPATPEGTTEFKPVRVETIWEPHPFCITDKHFPKDGSSSIKPEQAPCGMQGCGKRYDEHEQRIALRIAVKQNKDLKAVPGLEAYLLAIKPTTDELGIEAFLFPTFTQELQAERAERR